MRNNLAPPPQNQAPNAPPLAHTKLTLGGWIIVSCFTVFLALFIRTFIFQSFRIPSTSMVPTLEIGDHILVNKFWYGPLFPGTKDRVFLARSPKAGEVVVFTRIEAKRRSSYYIKRIVAVPGDVVQVKNFRTFVNDQAFDPPEREILFDRVLEGKYDEFRDTPRRKLERDEYFVLGDNRANSEDSRFFGAVRLEDIIGRASVVYFSLVDESDGLGVRWSRLGKKIR